MIKDYHTHTCNSDGTKTPKELMDLALENGVSCLAISDHDSIKGLEAGESYARGKLDFIPGVEFTTREENYPGTDTKYCLHLLGYGFDIHSKELNLALENREKRVKNAFDILIKSLEKYGMFFEYSQVRKSCGIVMQMLDIAAHIEKNYSQNPNLKKAVEDVYNYSDILDGENFSLEKSIELIHKAGGKAVWAHPYNVYRNFLKQIISKQQVEKILQKAVSLGVDGIEAIYGDFSKDERLSLCKLAEKYGLFVTCGSDYHGFKNKRNHFISFDIEEYSQFKVL